MLENKWSRGECGYAQCIHCMLPWTEWTNYGFYCSIISWFKQCVKWMASGRLNTNIGFSFKLLLVFDCFSHWEQNKAFGIHSNCCFNFASMLWFFCSQRKKCSYYFSPLSAISANWFAVPCFMYVCCGLWSGTAAMKPAVIYCLHFAEQFVVFIWMHFTFCELKETVFGLIALNHKTKNEINTKRSFNFTANTIYSWSHTNSENVTERMTDIFIH